MDINPVLLIIRDGWGSNPCSEQDAFNAVKRAETPCADRLSREWPRTELSALGRDVGLPEGVIGNSEVGHQNIGAGRIVDQEIVRINKAFETGAIEKNAVLQSAFDQARQGRGRLHLMGLISDAGVHAMLQHLYELLKWAEANAVPEAYLHVFTDGRDTPPDSGLGYIREVERYCRELGIGRIATVCGRFWSMDRDLRWERVQKTYDCLTGRSLSAVASSAEQAVQHYYDHPIDASRKGDEFVIPTAIVEANGQPIATVNSGDALICFNFRGDRPREITRAFIETSFNGFSRGPRLALFYATMTEYEKGLCENVIFPKPPKMPHILGDYVAAHKIAQFRCAETEKYPHVTFFFNDYREQPFDHEHRVLIPSPKEVSTYDQKPEMSAEAVCEATRNAILSGKYGLLVVNFANPDMVGHTGSLETTIQACSVVDRCVQKLMDAADQKRIRAVVTADHGNADQMWDLKRKGPHTAHTLNPVELVVYGRGCQGYSLRPKGLLADIAPTLLHLIGLAQPQEMTGESLINSQV